MFNNKTNTIINKFIKFIPVTKRLKKNDKEHPINKSLLYYHQFSKLL